MAAFYFVQIPMCHCALLCLYSNRCYGVHFLSLWCLCWTHRCALILYRIRNTRVPINHHKGFHATAQGMFQNGFSSKLIHVPGWISCIRSPQTWKSNIPGQHHYPRTCTIFGEMLYRKRVKSVLKKNNDRSILRHPSRNRPMVWMCLCYLDDVIKCKHFPRYWPFVRGIHRSQVNSSHKGQWREALMVSLICAWKKRLSKQSRGWWFETPSLSLWRRCNDVDTNNPCKMLIYICVLWELWYR